MAVTPNYGWPVPVATDYVKDGWEAISDLGNAIDTTVAGLGGGLTHITTATITTQSAFNITNCFSSTYDNYVLVFNLTAASAYSSLRFQMLQNTTPATAQYYWAARGLTSTNTNADFAQANVGSINVCDTNLSDPYQCSAIIGINKPFLTVNTTFHLQASQSNGSAYFCQNGSGLLYDTTSYNGIRLVMISGTFSGVARIYGYQNS